LIIGNISNQGYVKEPADQETPTEGNIYGMACNEAAPSPTSTYSLDLDAEGCSDYLFGKNREGFFELNGSSIALTIKIPHIVILVIIDS
jgi:hypothetical protein